MRHGIYGPCFGLLLACGTGDPGGGFSTGSLTFEPGGGGAEGKDATTDADEESETSAGGGEAGPETDGADDGAPSFDLGGPEGTTGGGGACPTPELVIALDRSFTMRRLPSGEDAGNHVNKTKWAHAIKAVETFSAHYEGSIEIGLELFPSPPDGDFCAKFSKIQDMDFGDELCTVEAGLLPALHTAQTIDDKLDPENTRLCRGTPIATALERAGETLAQGDSPSRNVVVVTDGRQRCSGNPVARAKELAANDILVFAVGFGKSASEPAAHRSLNELACAGRTAESFAVACVDDGSGGYDPVDPSGPALYIAAEDGPALTSALEGQIAGEICCGSACPPG